MTGASSAPAPPPPPPPPTLLDSVLASILEPGAGPGLVATVNAALLALLALLAVVALASPAPAAAALAPHLAALALLDLGLLASFNYFIANVGAPAAAGVPAEAAPRRRPAGVTEAAAARSRARRGAK